MTNPYVAAMLPAPPLPVEELAPEQLMLYLEGLDQISATPGPLGEAARARADELRPAAAALVEEQARRRKRDTNVRPL